MNTCALTLPSKRVKSCPLCPSLLIHRSDKAKVSDVCVHCSLALIPRYLLILRARIFCKDSLIIGRCSGVHTFVWYFSEYYKKIKEKRSSILSHLFICVVYSWTPLEREKKRVRTSQFSSQFLQYNQFLSLALHPPLKNRRESLRRKERPE